MVILHISLAPDSNRKWKVHIEVFGSRQGQD